MKLKFSEPYERDGCRRVNVFKVKEDGDVKVGVLVSAKDDGWFFDRQIECHPPHRLTFGDDGLGLEEAKERLKALVIFSKMVQEKERRKPSIRRFVEMFESAIHLAKDRMMEKIINQKEWK